MHNITDGCIFNGKGQLYISHLPGDEQMRELIRETGCGVFSLDMAMAGDSYFDAMYHNIDTIKEALG